VAALALLIVKGIKIKATTRKSEMVKWQDKDSFLIILPYLHLL